MVDLQTIDSINKVPADILFEHTFLTKIVTQCKPKIYLSIIEKYKFLNPFDDIAQLINVPLFNYRFDIVSLLVSKSFDIFSSDLWNYLDFTESFFVYRKRNHSKVIYKILKTYTCSQYLSNPKHVAIINGLVKNNQLKYINFIISQYQSDSPILAFLIDMLTLAAVQYQNHNILESKFFNKMIFIPNPEKIVLNLFQIRNKLSYCFASAFLNKFKEIWSTLLRTRTSITSLYDVLAILPSGHDIIKTMENEGGIESYDHMFEIVSINSWSPIHNAARWGDFETLKFLFERYREKSIMYTEPYSKSYDTKHNLLSLALRNADTNICMFILEKVDNIFVDYWSRFNDVIVATLYSPWISEDQRIYRLESLISRISQTSQSQIISNLCNNIWSDSGILEKRILGLVISKITVNHIKKILQKIENQSREIKLEIVKLILSKLSGKTPLQKFNILKTLLFYIPYTFVNIFSHVSDLDEKYRYRLYIQILVHNINTYFSQNRVKYYYKFIVDQLHPISKYNNLIDNCLILDRSLPFVSDSLIPYLISCRFCPLVFKNGNYSYCKKFRNYITVYVTIRRYIRATKFRQKSKHFQIYRKTLFELENFAPNKKIPALYLGSHNHKHIDKNDFIRFHRQINKNPIKLNYDTIFSLYIVGEVVLIDTRNGKQIVSSNNYISSSFWILSCLPKNSIFLAKIPPESKIIFIIDAICTNFDSLVLPNIQTRMSPTNSDIDEELQICSSNNCGSWKIHWLNIYSNDIYKASKHLYDNFQDIPPYIGGILVRPNNGLLHKSTLVPIVPSIILQVNKHGIAYDAEKNKYNIYFKDGSWSEGLYECIWSKEKDAWEAYQKLGIMSCIGYFTKLTENPSSYNEIMETKEMDHSKLFPWPQNLC